MSKGVSGVYKLKELNELSLSLLHLSEESKTVLSEPIDILEDGYSQSPKREYRCWVTKNQLVSISRHFDYETDYKIPKKIAKFAKLFIKEHKGTKLENRDYSLDLAETRDRGLVVIELNPLSSSGRYEKNDFENFLKIISQN